MRSANPSERGSVYITVLSVAVLVTVIGVGALLAEQVRGGEAIDSRDMQQAQQLSRAAIELGLLAVRSDSSWRKTYGSGKWSDAVGLGRGSISWQLVDEADANLANNDTDAVRLYGMGVVGACTRVTSVVLSAVSTPYDVMRTAVHTESAMTVSVPLLSPPVVITVSGGPASSKTVLTNAGKIVGDIEVGTYVGAGTVTGSKTLLAPAKTKPSASVFDDYLAAATPPTTIAWNATNFPYSVVNLRNDFNFDVLTATMSAPNSVPLNSDGLYLINVPALSKLYIDKCRLKCTLLIDAGAGSTIHLGGQVLWSPQRSDYPLVIVRGAATVEVDGNGSNSISESSLGKNLNPPGFPYGGATNATKADTYPAELDGVIHIIGSTCTTALCSQLVTNGCIICEGPVTYPNGSGTPAAVLTVDPAIATNPPRGYYTVRMNPIAGTWRRDAAP